jgi:hypothetical protein
MLIDQKLLEKLKPHADRIAEGGHNEYDFLPATLLHGLRGNQRVEDLLLAQSKILNAELLANKERLDAVKLQIEKMAEDVALREEGSQKTLTLIKRLVGGALALVTITLVAMIFMVVKR